MSLFNSWSLERKSDDFSNYFADFIGIRLFMDRRILHYSLKGKFFLLKGETDIVHGKFILFYLPRYMAIYINKIYVFLCI